MTKTLEIEVREEHLDRAVREMRDRGQIYPTGHGLWCVMAQASKDAFPPGCRISSGSTSLTVFCDDNLPQGFAGADHTYGDITSLFDSGKFDELRKQLPKVVTVIERGR